MKNIMLDVETMSVAPTAAIVAIGAVEFDLDEGNRRSFYKIVNLQSCIDLGLTVDGDTVLWWLGCSRNVKIEICKNKKSIKVVLEQFLEWLPKGNFQLWGNGADFDNAILTNAYRSIGIMKPWPHVSNRCFRTIKSSFPSLESQVSRVNKHIAIEDAIDQAFYLRDLVKKYNLEFVL